MYLPSHFAQTDDDALRGLISDFPLAALVFAAVDGLEANHLPLIAEERDGAFVLRGHLARGNPAWRQISDGTEALAIFQGPAAYVSPAWYPAKAEHGKVVPTYNYAVVHAYGPLRLVEEPGALRQLLATLTDRFEAPQPKPWHLGDAPADYLEKMVASVVGVEMQVTRLVGKWKLSQNRNRSDRQGAKRGLLAAGGSANQLAAMMSED